MDICMIHLQFQKYDIRLNRKTISFISPKNVDFLINRPAEVEEGHEVISKEMRVINEMPDVGEDCREGQGGKPEGFKKMKTNGGMENYEKSVKKV